MKRDHHALADHIATASVQAFVWGRNDCVRFAAAAVQAQTGVDPLKGLPTWRSRAGAMRVLSRLGGLDAAVDRALTKIAPSMAKRGDIALVINADGSTALAVVEGETLIGLDATGGRRLPRSAMVKAWSAG